MPCLFCLMSKEKVVKFGNKKFLLIRICTLPESLVWSSFLSFCSNKVVIYGYKVAIYSRAASALADCSCVWNFKVQLSFNK